MFSRWVTLTEFKAKDMEKFLYNNFGYSEKHKIFPGIQDSYIKLVFENKQDYDYFVLIFSS